MKYRGFVRQLRDYQKRARAWRNKIAKCSSYHHEANTVIKFVIPLLQILGWNPLSKDMDFEYHLKDKKGSTRHADIALFVNKSDKPKVLVEIKRFWSGYQCGAKEVFRYLVGSRVKYGIVTNGTDLELYSSKFVRHSYKRANRVFTLRLEDFVNYKDVLRIISKENIKRGVFDKFIIYHHSHKDGNKWRKPQPTEDKDYNKNYLPLEKVKYFLNNYKEITSK